MSAIVAFEGDPCPHERVLRERLQDEFAGGVAIVGLRFELGKGFEIVSAMAHAHLCPGSSRGEWHELPQLRDVRARVEEMLLELGLVVLPRMPM